MLHVRFTVGDRAVNNDKHDTGYYLAKGGVDTIIKRIKEVVNDTGENFNQLVITSTTASHEQRDRLFSRLQQL